MRTPAEAQSSPASAPRETVAGRRGRTLSRAAPAAEAPLQPAIPEPAAIAVTTVRLLPVEEGLHALRIGEIAGDVGIVSGMAVPAAQVSAPFAEDGNGVEIVAAFPRRGPWLGKEGGTAILRSPRGGGFVLVTVYGGPSQPAADLAIDLQRLDVPADRSEGEGP